MNRLPTPLVLVFTVALAAPAFAQRPDRAQMEQRMAQMAPGAVTGTVLDAESGEPVATASIAVWRDGPDGSEELVTGAVTDAAGAFRVDRLRPGTYRVTVSFLGYAAQAFEEVEVTRAALVADLGEVRLAPDAAQLDAVEVTGERELVQIEADRTVYNVAEQPVAETGSATDLLQTVPSVEVDIDGNVSLRGNGNVAILLNGRTVPVSGAFLANLLRQMPASSIERVEVIPNPSAKYDPEGMGGIINIVTKEDADLGLSGGLTLGAGSNGGYSGSANLAYGRGRVTATGSYGFRRDVRESSGTTSRTNRFAVPTTFLDQTSGGDRAFTSHLLNASLDYEVADKTTLGLTGLLSARDGGADGFNTFAFLAEDAATLTSRFDRLSDGDSEGLNADLALVAGWRPQPGEHELTAEARYNRATDDDLETFTQLALDPDSGDPLGGGVTETNDLRRETDQVTLQADYVRPLPAGVELEAGYKGDFQQLSNTFDAEFSDGRDDDALDNTFGYDETVHAGYGLLTRSFGALELKGGLRVERAATEFTLRDAEDALAGGFIAACDAAGDCTFENGYWSAFPSAFATFKLADTRQLKASYSKRVRRPRTFFLNPFTTFDDPLNLRRGNPFLLPEYTHSFEVGYAQFSQRGSLTLTPYYRHTTDAISRFKTLDPATGVSTLTFENFQTEDSYGVEAIVSARPAGWLNGFLSFDANRSVSNAENVEAGLDNEAFGWSVRGNVQAELPQGFALQAFAFYRAPRDIPNGRISSFSMTNLSLRKQLLGERASLTLQVQDVFDTMGFAFELDDEDFFQEAEREWQSRVATLAFTYTFGQPQRPDRRARGGRPDGGFDEVGID